MVNALSNAVETIQLILAPVVMITACASLLTSTMNRYLAVVKQLESLAQERLDILKRLPREGDRSDLIQQRFEEINLELPELLYRYHQLHNAVLLVYIAIILFLASMFILAFSTSVRLMWIQNLALLVFLIAITNLFAGMVILGLEFRNTHCITDEQVRRACGLK